MVGPRGEGYLTLIQGLSEFMNHVPTILNSWDCPTLGHLQHSTSLPHPAAVAVITGRATRLPLTRSLPPRGIPPSQGCPGTKWELQGTFHLIPSCETPNKINLPFLCACLQWPSLPPNSNTPRWSGPHWAPGRTMKMGLLSTDLHNSPASETPTRYA